MSNPTPGQTTYSPETQALAVHEKDGDLRPYTFNRRELREKDVAVRILYAGVCHTDIHNIKNAEGRPLSYPMVPGHEINGRSGRRRRRRHHALSGRARAHRGPGGLLPEVRSLP